MAVLYIPAQVSLGSQFELKLSDLTITDNVTTNKDFLADKLTITMVKPDGTTKVTNTGTDGKNYIWKIGKLYLTHGEEDTYYQDCKHILNLSYVAPFSSIERYG